MAEELSKARPTTVEVASGSATEERLWGTLREVCELFEGLEPADSVAGTQTLTIIVD